MQQEVNWKTFRAQFDVSTKAQQVHMITQQLPNFAVRPDWVSVEVWTEAVKRCNPKAA
jgi:hypothetical protein